MDDVLFGKAQLTLKNNKAKVQQEKLITQIVAKYCGEEKNPDGIFHILQSRLQSASWTLESGVAKVAQMLQGDANGDLFQRAKATFEKNKEVEQVKLITGIVANYVKLEKEQDGIIHQMQVALTKPEVK